MVEHTSQRSLRAALPAEPADANLSTTRVRSSSFKYYIHDASGALRLKLIGELKQADIAELSGCWRTARTTLAGRKLILDLRSLKMVDEAGRQWLAAMAQEGASCVPEDYLLTCIPGQHAPHLEREASAPRVSLFGKLVSFFRSAPGSATQSSTRQAQ
jgi:ABC-type transporter Mla MlaB component